MIKKIGNKVLNKIREKTLSDLENDVQELGKRIDKTQAENKSLILEFMVEQRLRAERDLHGGVFQIHDREVATRIFNDSIMYLDPRDIAVVPHIILEGVWEKQITRAWLHVLQKRDATVFDIGANFGYFGMLAAQVLDIKKSKVVLFEANPALLSYIHKTLSVNWLNENTVIEGLAVSDKKGFAELNILEDYTGSSSMHSIEHLNAYLSHKMQIKAENVIKVPTITIDDYCVENNIDHIDLIKMDIEGYEEKAYAGMRKIVKKSPEIILFIEFTKDGYEQPEAFYKTMLKDFGHIYTIDPSGDLKVPKDKSYDSVVGGASDWVMLVFSKKQVLKK